MQSEEQKRSSSQSEQKKYSKPQMVIYGGIGELTKNSGNKNTAAADGGTSSNHNKTR